MRDSIGFLLYDCARLFRKELNDRSRGDGVTGLQLRLLAHVARAPGINQGPLAQLLEVEPITLSRMIDRLGEAGLIERRVDPGDRRAWCLYLTPAAGPVVARLKTVVGDVQADALRGFSDKDRETLQHLVERMRANLSPKDECDDRPSRHPIDRRA